MCALDPSKRVKPDDLAELMKKVLKRPEHYNFMSNDQIKQQNAVPNAWFYRVIIHSVSIFLKKKFYVFKCKWGDFSYTCSSEYDISFAADFSQKSQITAEKNYFYEIQVFRNWSIIVANFDQIWLFQNKCFANFIDFTSCLNEY